MIKVTERFPWNVNVKLGKGTIHKRRRHFKKKILHVGNFFDYPLANFKKILTLSTLQIDDVFYRRPQSP